MGKVVTLDLGPAFLGARVEIDGEKVCTLAPAVFHDEQLQRHVREMMEGQGTSCSMCRGCPVGAAG